MAIIANNPIPHAVDLVETATAMGGISGKGIKGTCPQYLESGDDAVCPPINDQVFMSLMHFDAQYSNKVGYSAET